ncbi:DNA gyrase/topoisomerase IV subunit B [Nanchangia anserum]|uniref:DNA gyrase/topoisomerase IV subunit B n=1 Tax=Nanchangia anserum TaxID=2692125 RepID=UPI001D11ED98|nr:DNA topoisomerase IV subunit B [Nanchangia anserum]
MTGESSTRYDGSNLQVLEGLEAVRIRPGMYIGSTDRGGLMHCLWEIIDNSVDEALVGHCDRIEVRLEADGSASVRDNGRGIPVDEVPGTGLSGLAVVFTKLHAGGKFGSSSYASVGGLHGVGASVVNALSQRLDVEVTRSSKRHRLQFRRGEAGTYADAGDPDPRSPFTPEDAAHALHQVGKAKRGLSGTYVRFWPDPDIFPDAAGEGFDLDGVLDRLRQTAFLVPGLRLVVEDHRGDDVVREELIHTGGVVDYVDYLSTDAPITDTWRYTGERVYTETVQHLDEESGHVHTREMERTCVVDVALRWGIGYDTLERSFVNIVATPKGGTHVAGFEAAVVKVIRQAIAKNRKSKRLKLGAKEAKIEKDDVMAGLSAVITVRLPEPQFEGQTKEILGTPQVRQAVNSVVTEGLAAQLASTKRDDKQQAFALLEKVVGEMRARVSARMHKEISRRKTALETSSLPAKLADCRSNDVDGSELFIVEGDSALGTAKQARSAEFQALLPIRGKILNVQKASTSDMLSNAECAAIIQVVGAGSGRSFDVDAARYGKVIMMTDADVDGAHIRTLLLTLFFRYMRPLIEAGRVYAAVPPLHRIEVMAKGRKPREYVYTYSEDQLHAKLAELRRAGRTWKDPVQRYKGLGEMDADQLAETTMDPAKRTLRRITLADEAIVAQAEEVFELLMGQQVAPRRSFIVSGAAELTREQIDA